MRRQMSQCLVTLGCDKTSNRYQNLGREDHADAQ